MHKVLLVDDEQIIREGISSLIDWESQGWSFIGAARNGIEAYEIIIRERPSVVITDLKMPVLDGLGLVAKVTERIKTTVFIILSGYGEFELAKEAMRHGIKHYLLKPCNENEIIDVLREVRNDLIQSEQMELFKEKQGTNRAVDTLEYPPNIKTANRLIQTILYYVQNHLDNEDLSLKWLARQVIFMNVSYLSKLFVKETGERFSHYLMRIRMERAKQLIAIDADSRVCEVALSVGLGNNPQYFSQLFKRFTGCTPSEYKKGN